MMSEVYKNWRIRGFKPLTSKNDVHRVRFCFLDIPNPDYFTKKGTIGKYILTFSSLLGSPLIGEADDKERHVVLLIIDMIVAVEICCNISNYKLTRGKIF